MALFAVKLIFAKICDREIHGEHLILQIMAPPGRLLEISGAKQVISLLRDNYLVITICIFLVITTLLSRYNEFIISLLRVSYLVITSFVLYIYPF